jgi:hypothetical protein
MKILFATLALLALSGCPNTAKMSLGTFRGQYIISFHPVDETEAIYEIRHTSNASDE